jgi:hypothetical protein
METGAQTCGNCLSARLVVTCPCSPLAAQTALMLKRVVAKFVRENMTQHEVSERVARPRHDT